MEGIWMYLSISVNFAVIGYGKLDIRGTNITAVPEDIAVLGKIITDSTEGS